MTLGYLSFTINMPAIAYCMFVGDNASLVGLLMVHALNLSDEIVGFTLEEAGFETQLVSVERLYRFMKIEPEKRY